MNKTIEIYGRQVTQLPSGKFQVGEFVCDTIDRVKATIWSFGYEGHQIDAAQDMENDSFDITTELYRAEQAVKEAKKNKDGQALFVATEHLYNMQVISDHQWGTSLYKGNRKQFTKRLESLGLNSDPSLNDAIHAMRLPE